MISELLESRAKQGRRDEEDDDTKYLSKNQLIKMAAESFLVPAADSKGVTRSWIIGILKGDNYRVEIMDLKRFEATLRPSQTRKVSFISLDDLMTRLNKYLRETNRLEMGFGKGIICEESYLLRLTRYADPGNVLGVFSGPVSNSPPNIHCPSSEMLLAQQKASKFLLGKENKLLEVPSVLASVKQVGVTFQKRAIISKELESITKQVEAVKKKKEQLDSELQSAVLKASTTLLAHGEGLQDPEEIFEESKTGEALRMKLNKVSKL